MFMCFTSVTLPKGAGVGREVPSGILWQIWGGMRGERTAGAAKLTRVSRKERLQLLLLEAEYGGRWATSLAQQDISYDL